MKNYRKYALMFTALALPTLAHAGGFSVLGGVDWSYGSLGDGNTVQSRSVDTLALRVYPNYDLATAISSLPVPLRVGIIFSYGWTGQISDPASYGGQNLRGHGYRAGIGVGSDFGKFGVLAGLNVLGSYSLSNQNSSGQDVGYSGYLGGVLSASYQMLPYLAPTAIFEYGGYGKGTTGGTSVDLSNKLTGWSIGVGATIRYPFANDETKKEGEVK